jgi:hypothetical protein
MAGWVESVVLPNIRDPVLCCSRNVLSGVVSHKVISEAVGGVEVLLPPVLFPVPEAPPDLPHWQQQRVIITAKEAAKSNFAFIIYEVE